MGKIQSEIGLEVELDDNTGNATITLSGPAGKWFGVGFGASAMADLPYAIIVDGGGKVVERKLANHAGGVELPATVSVVRNEVAVVTTRPVMRNHRGPQWSMTNATDRFGCEAECRGSAECAAWTYVPPRWATVYNMDTQTCILRGAPQGEQGFTDQGWLDGMWSGEKATTQLRTVVLTRKLKGASDQYYSFSPRDSGINFINAVGTTPDYQYHGTTRSGATLMLVEAGSPVCICKGATLGGSINGLPWSNNCAPYPATTILRDHNPSCSIETYGGGMICCHHEVHLLDADQTVPAPTDTFRMKFRFYYEDPVPNVNRNVFFMFHEVEQNHGEYDVPKCKAGTPPEECVHTIVGHFTLQDMMRECHDRSDVWCAQSKPKYPQSNKVQLIHISPHCHGPACISMEMINADTNETICKTHPVWGTGDEAMNEAGYVAGIPPCLWGSKEEGLLPPPVLPLNTNITAIKRVNATNYHYGVMAHWQVRAAWADGPPDTF